jgi:hypothetical protein
MISVATAASDVATADKERRVILVVPPCRPNEK